METVDVDAIEVWRIKTPHIDGSTGVLLYAFAPSLRIAARYDTLHAQHAASADDLLALSGAPPYSTCERVKTAPLTTRLKQFLHYLQNVTDTQHLLGDVFRGVHDDA